MITFEELQTYTQEELFQLKDMISEILSNKVPIMDDFFNNYLNANNLQVITIKTIYEKYQEYCKENNPNITLSKQHFYNVASKLIERYGIKLTARKKEKIEKVKDTGDKVEKIEK